jgi:hypothetical protein
MKTCEVCGYCPCCGKLGKELGHAWVRSTFPKRTKALEEHYEIFPEHSPNQAAYEAGVKSNKGEMK